MPAPFDMTKLRKKVDKSIPGISYGFNDPTTWLSTGCYALNYHICGRFNGGVPLEGKFSMLAGDSGSGKSYIASANIVKSAQEAGVYVVIFDSENALDQSWMDALGVDTSPEKMERISVAKIDDLAKYMGELIDAYKERNSSLPYEKRGKMLMVIDGFGMLITGNQEQQFNEGDQKGDMGIKAKQITATIRVAMAKISAEPIGLVATNHVFDSQDKYKPDAIPGGKMLEFASSVIVQMNKYLLKEDEHGVKLVDGKVAGVKSTCVVRKSRYSKPFEKIVINIPYEQGMNPYSGLFDFFQSQGALEKAGNRWNYTSPVTGEVFSEFKRDYLRKGLLDTIMEEWPLWEDKSKAVGFDHTDSAGEGEPDDE